MFSIAAASMAAGLAARLVTYEAAAEAGYLHSGAVLTPATHEEGARAWSGGVTLGRYWSDHWKTELQVQISAGSSRAWTQAIGNWEWHGEPILDAFQAWRVHRHRSVSLLQQYQFLRNRWIHPVLGAGLMLDSDSVETTPDYGRPEEIFAALPNGTTTRLRPMVSAGIKWYVSPHVFLRTGGAFGVSREPSLSSLRIGVGGDW